MVSISPIKNQRTEVYNERTPENENGEHLKMVRAWKWYAPENGNRAPEMVSPWKMVGVWKWHKYLKMVNLSSK